MSWAQCGNLTLSADREWACALPVDHSGPHRNVSDTLTWPNTLLPRRTVQELSGVEYDVFLRERARRTDKGSDIHIRSGAAREVSTGNLTDYTRGFRAGKQFAVFETYLIGEDG